MTLSIRDERRALSADEQAAVDLTHRPALAELADDALRTLVRRVREYRDRAQTDVARRRRERRGKAAPKGAEASRREDGSSRKAEVLAAAVRRLNAEVERRRQKARQVTTAEAARQALALRRASADQRGRPVDAGRTAGRGMADKGNRKAGRIGSAMEAGRVSQFVKNAQAARDSR